MTKLKEITFEDLWKLNPSGDKEKCNEIVTNRLYFSETTLEDLYRSYKDYLGWWNQQHGDKDPKYIGKANQLKDLYTFVSNDEYNNEWKSLKSNRDFYLYGDTEEEEIIKQYEAFKRSEPGIS